MRKKKKPVAKAHQANQSNNTETRVVTAQRHISGPLPSADEMAKYDAISPQVTQRIFDLAESEAVHRRGLEKKVITYQGREVAAGQIFGLIVALAGFSLAGYAFNLGYPGYAITVGGAVLVSLVSVFIKGRPKDSK